MALYFLPLLIIVLIIIQGYFSGSEMAMVSSNKIRMKNLTNKGAIRASIINKYLSNPEWLFGTTLVGVNTATVIATILSDYYFEIILRGKYPSLDHFIPIAIMPLLIMHPLIVIFGEIFPMLSARKHPDATALKNAIILRASSYIFYPLILFVSGVSRLINFLLRNKAGTFGDITRDELLIIFNGRYEKANKMTRKVVHDALRIKELTALDVMIHLNDVKAVSEDMSVSELEAMILSSQYSRFPVYSETIFNIVSTIHVTSILSAKPSESIKLYTEKLYIIPSSKKVLDILKELKTNRKYMAIVVDEYGAACGIITLENIAEEIVGEINDSFASDTTDTNANTMIFDALTYLDDFYETTGIDLRNENAETISGIINISLGHIGRKDEIVDYKGLVKFQIIDASDRAVKTVKVIP